MSIPYFISVILSGLLFGAGLVYSQVVNPEKIFGFLDIMGNWDPSLILVMATALGVSVPAFYIIEKRPHPIFDKRFYAPDFEVIDKKLIIGSILFGIGWAMVGLCPGPGFASLAFGLTKSFVFVPVMLLGHYVGHILFFARGK